ncbi:MAG: cytochrome-c oxidase, cbb3-type subunit I [Myxococcaceae bacterium]|nr:cytochrome-c oxidase, cbb3-type subunit I [Myxococcaceae bacterium]MBH2006073.1 cytochrome-c oxidase, cbb3-type subunit I [Myxococcaceae bacterium]
MKQVKITYNDSVVRQFIWASLFFGLVGMLVGVLIAAQLADPRASFGLSWLSFGRIRPLHTNAVIFAFVGNMLFAGIYYSTQRLLKARLASDFLSSLHFWGWQAIIVAAALTLPLGITQSKEYAELEWPIDLAVVAIWVVFGINFFWTLAKRREKHLYVAIWFYISTIITIAVLYVVNNLAIPVSWTKSYSVFAGVQDALVQWWYGHNAVAFFLTTPILGIMYYFIPKAAERPVYSYRLSMIHFWSLIFLYIWAGPHHLLNSALPDWTQSMGMLFSVMLWAPSWGGMINGLLTLRGAWNKLRTDPVLKFFIAAVTFYGMSTLEGPLLSIKSISALAHYTDWVVGHVHSGALGWNGFMAAGMFYWLVPRLYSRELYSKAAADFHFWIATFGIVLYVMAMWVGGITQSLMWRAMTPEGSLLYPNFVETLVAIRPMYWMRLVGGSLYLFGFVLMIWNLLMTMSLGKATDTTVTVLETFPEAAPRSNLIFSPNDHRFLEGRPLLFTGLVTLAILAGGIAELIPTILSETQAVDGKWPIRPYTALELHGRDIYVREGCYNCHSQMIRPFQDEEMRYGAHAKLTDFIFDHPFQWGSKRTGPDLQRVGKKYPNIWHFYHMQDPRAISPGSNMPSYDWLSEQKVDFSLSPIQMNAMKHVGVPYSEAEVLNAEISAQSDAKALANALQEEGASLDYDAEMIALIAYLQSLGTR